MHIAASDFHSGHVIMSLLVVGGVTFVPIIKLQFTVFIFFV